MYEQHWHKINNFFIDKTKAPIYMKAELCTTQDELRLARFIYLFHPEVAGWSIPAPNCKKICFRKHKTCL